MKKTELKKETELKPVCIYRNKEHEETTKRELAQAQDALQSVLNVWNGLDLIPITDIFQLIINPSKLYSEAIEKLAVVPVQAGRFQVSKEAYIQTLDVPIPDSLYRSAKAARQFSYAGVPELWTVEGDKVVMNTSEAGYLIESQSLYANDSDKIALINDVKKSCELINSINDRLKGQYFPFNQGVYNLEIQPGRNNTIEINPTFEFLKRMAQSTL